MLENAISKLKTEMDSNKSNTYVQVVGGFLLQHINCHPQDAEKIMVTEKTIGKSLDEMRKVAEKKKSGNCAVLTDEEGFEVVLKYFGIKGKPASMTDIAPAPAEPTKQTPSFDIRLEDLL
ncbi:hypothetical protein JCM15765_14940 [Paradesulfitobacterium aromaticivorans]